MRLEIHDGSNWGDDGDTTPTICTMNADGSCGPPRLMIQSFGKDKAAEELADQIVKAANLHERLVEALTISRNILAEQFHLLNTLERERVKEISGLLAECK